MSNEDPTASPALLFIVITVLLDSIGFGIVIPVLPTLIAEISGADLARSAEYGGQLLFAFAAAQFLCAPLLGALSDRLGRRPVLLAALFLFGIDYLIMGCAPSLAWLFLGRILAGVAGGSYAPAYAYVADISPPEKRGARFGILGAAFGCGYILGPLIGGLLGEFGARLPFFCAAGLAFLNTLLGFFVLSESLPRTSRRAFSVRRANPVGALLQLRRYPAVVGLAAALFLWSLSVQSYHALLSFYTMFRFEWTGATVGYALGLLGFIMIFSQGYLAGRLIPQLGEARTARYGLLFGIAGYLIYAFAPSGRVMVVGLATYLFAGLIMPALYALMSRQVPADEQGELQGANACLYSLSSIVGPPVLTHVFGYFSRESAVVFFPGAGFLVAGAFACAGLLVFHVYELNTKRVPT